jgi:hypothetical protein
LSPNFKEAKRQSQNLRRERFKKIERQIKLEDSNSKKTQNSQGIQPLAYFWKYFLTNENENFKLKVNIPDTIVLNDIDINAFWLYTNELGLVEKNENFTSKDIVNRLGNYGNGDELVALSKKPQYNIQGNLVGNDIKLMSTKEISFWSRGLVIGKKGGFISFCFSLFFLFLFLLTSFFEIKFN